MHVYYEIMKKMNYPVARGQSKSKLKLIQKDNL
jgi:hypothetical protein